MDAAVEISERTAFCIVSEDVDLRVLLMDKVHVHEDTIYIKSVRILSSRSKRFSSEFQGRAVFVRLCRMRHNIFRI